MAEQQDATLETKTAQTQPAPQAPAGHSGVPMTLTSMRSPGYFWERTSSSCRYCLETARAAQSRPVPSRPSRQPLHSSPPNERSGIKSSFSPHRASLSPFILPSSVPPHSPTTASALLPSPRPLFVCAQMVGAAEQGRGARGGESQRNVTDRTHGLNNRAAQDDNETIVETTTRRQTKKKKEKETQETTRSCEKSLRAAAPFPCARVCQRG